MRDVGRLALLGRPAVDFAGKTDLRFHRRVWLAFHANGMSFAAFDPAGAAAFEGVYYPVGGGIVVSNEIAADGT